MPKAALCSDGFAPASVAGCSNLYLLFTVVIGEGCRSSRSDSVPLCCQLNVCENSFVYWEFPKAGVFDLQQSLLEQGEREHIPLFAVGEDLCCCLTQTLLFFWAQECCGWYCLLVVIVRKMKAPGKSDISSLAMKVSLLSGFCSAKDSVWLNEVVWVTLGKVRKLCMECIHPEIATAKLNSIFDCWTF